MRIISGHARGILLNSPKDSLVRPTTDRVKESLFATLEPICGRVVVDLFAGSGALGLEACSRGAAQVFWVERKAGNCRLIARNLERVLHAMPEANVETRILQTDAFRVAERLPSLHPHIILADPPYTPEKGERGIEELFQSPTFTAWAGDALLVLEQAARTAFSLPPNWQLLRQRTYGNTRLFFLKPARSAERS